jgi:hypothetical protein
MRVLAAIAPQSKRRAPAPLAVVLTMPSGTADGPVRVHVGLGRSVVLGRHSHMDLGEGDSKCVPGGARGHVTIVGLCVSTRSFANAHGGWF